MRVLGEYLELRKYRAHTVALGKNAPELVVGGSPRFCGRLNVPAGVAGSPLTNSQTASACEVVQDVSAV